MFEFEFYLYNFECNNDVMFGQQIYLIFEIEPCDFRTSFVIFSPFGPRFPINFFLTTKRVSMSNNNSNNKAIVAAPSQGRITLQLFPMSKILYLEPCFWHILWFFRI